MREIGLFLIAAFLVGCNVVERQDAIDMGGLFETSEVEASKTNVNRKSEGWMERYCKERVMEAAQVPFEFERQRGPYKTFLPRYWPERYENGVVGEACDSDFYYWPVAVEAFEDMGIKHAYSDAVWQKFEDAVVASVSARLVSEGWQRVDHDESQEKPALMMERGVPSEQLVEYLDVFFTKNEEVVFEFLVVDKFRK